MNPLTQHGIKEHVKDERDILVGVVFNLPKLSNLPLEYSIDAPIKNQEQEDTCGRFASETASELQEGVPLDSLFTWVMARQESGEKPEDYGVGVRDIGLAHVNYGSLGAGQSPLVQSATDRGWRDIANWDIDGLLKKSVYHKKGSAVFVEPTNGMDVFDTIRATLWKFKDEDVAVVVGMHFPYSASVPIIENWVDGGFGHCVVITGYKVITGTMYLLMTNSWGENVGDKGKFYISREVANKEFPAFGAFFFHDETPERLKYFIENGLKVDDNAYKNIMIALWKAITDLFAKLLK